MARYRRSYNRSRYHKRSVGHERALEHIRQAEELSRELGGTDEDVKSYFFSLDAASLSTVFSEYERLYGQTARVYAENTIQKWKHGRVHMSGMVAGRLFELLPKHMPLEKKYKLTESLWRHVAPASRRTLYINPNVAPEYVVATVKEHLQRDVLAYTIPEQMEKRFSWLSQGDVEVKQKLLNFLRSKERELAAESLRINLPVLMEHLSGNQGACTHKIVQRLQIGRNEVAIFLTSDVEGISETEPRLSVTPSTESDFSWIWWGIVIAVLFALFQL